MTRSISTWRRLAALAALGWAAAAAPAMAQNGDGAPARATQLTAETRAGGTLTQPVAGSHDMTPASATAAQAKAAPAAATTQRTAYQQAPSSFGDAPPSPANRLMNQYEVANRAYMAEPLMPAQNPEPVAAGGTSCGCGAGGACGGGCGTGCNGGGDCLSCCDPYFYNGGWYVGAEYLYLRPNFSSPAGAVERTTVVDPTNNSSVITDRIIAYDIGYDSTFRVFGGYRWGDCGESLEFSYWRVEASEAFASPPATQSLFFASFLDAIADAPGETLRTDFNMELNVFDIDYSKRNPVLKGGPSTCGHCCPPWDWGWSLGARIADYDREHNNQVINAAGVVLSTGRVDTSFNGAGPRAGLEGRRYLGEQGLWSIYGTSHLALLLGDYEVTSSAVAGITTTNHVQDFIRTVPVTELEIGVSRQIGCRTLLSAGYEFQAWWEIGRFDTILIGNCECLTSSNVLSFDGFFVRLEHTFGPHCRPRCCN